MFKFKYNKTKTTIKNLQRIKRNQNLPPSPSSPAPAAAPSYHHLQIPNNTTYYHTKCIRKKAVKGKNWVPIPLHFLSLFVVCTILISHISTPPILCSSFIKLEEIEVPQVKTKGETHRVEKYVCCNFWHCNFNFHPSKRKQLPENLQY